MGRFFLLTALMLASFSIGLAQDDTEWTGFYFGGNGFVSSDQTTIDPANIPFNQITNVNVPGRGLVVVPGTTIPFAGGSKRNTNVGGGGQIGYQWRSGNVVIGAEGDYSPFRRSVTISQTFAMPQTILSPITTAVISRKVRFLHESSARMRVGYASGKTLIYGAGGYSFARIRVDQNDSWQAPASVGAQWCGPSPAICRNAPAAGPILFTSSAAQNRHGWNLGGGVERKLSKRYSIGFEFRHTDLGSRMSVADSYLATYPTPPTEAAIINYAPTNVSLKSNAFSVRFNFHDLFF